MDPIKIQAILSKKPKDVITAEEWNEILNLLITQANLFSDKLQGFQGTLQSLIDGKLENVDITANVNSFGGHPPEDYTLDAELVTELKKITDYVDTELIKKLTKPDLTANRILVSGIDKSITASPLSVDVLNNLSTTYLGINAKAKDSEKIEGKQIFVQQAQPTATSVGDIWISW